MKYICTICVVLLLLVSVSAPAALIAHWKFDEGSGTTVADQTGNHNGTLPGVTGPASFTAGHVNSALDVSTGPAGISCGNASNGLFTGQAMTVTAWINPKNGNGSGAIIGHMNDGGDGIPGGGMGPQQGWFFFHNTGGTQPLGHMVLGATIGGWGDTGSSTSAVPGGQWNHVAVTYDGTNCRYYLNGQPDGVVSRPGTIAPVTTSPIYLASEPGWNSQPSNLIIDEVKLYNEVLSDAAILAEYNLAPLPAADLTINSDPAAVTSVSPFVNETQTLLVQNLPIAISASPQTDCPGNVRYEFSYWSLDSNVDISTEPNQASTTLTIIDPNLPGQITAHYTTTTPSAEECGPVWDLSDDMQNVSNPGPWIAKSTGSGRWSYYGNGTLFPTKVNSNPNAECNGELPYSGIGWTGAPGGNHIALNRYASADGPNTNYQVGECGGHAQIAARWETDHAGTFLVDASGFNARKVSLGRGLGMTLTRNTVTIATASIDANLNQGSANAVVLPTTLVQAQAGDYIELLITGPDWAGMSLTIAEVVLDSTLTIVTNPAVVDTVSPYVGTQDQVAGIAIPISAQEYIDCATATQYAFDHWVEDSNVDVNDVNAAVTTVTILAPGAAQVTAVYTEVAGAPACAYTHWDLAEDMLKSVDPDNLSGASNPSTVGSARWSYYHSGRVPFTTATNIATAPGSVNGEVPNAGFGWVNSGANWIMMMKFTMDALLTSGNPNGDKTNFVIGDVGGHAAIAAEWKTLADGWFQIQYGAYNARNQALASGNEGGRVTGFVLTVADQVMDSKAITGGIEDGSANAYTGTLVRPLAANDTVIAEHQGNEWCGLQLTIDKLETPATLTISATGTEPDVPAVTPYLGTQSAPINLAIPISAPRYGYLSCEDDRAFELDHWEVVSGNAIIADINAADTTVTLPTASASEIRAVYTDARVCGDECHSVPAADISEPKDCKVNMDDLRILAESWLNDNNPL